MMRTLPPFRRVIHGGLRDHLAVLLLTLAWMLSGARSPAATVLWSGAGGDGLWSNPLNWNGGVLPTSADDVVINVPGATAVRMNAGNVKVRSLQCEESFILQNGSFTLTNGASVINGAFNVLSFQSLTVDGATATLTVNGSVTNLAGRLYALNGGVIELPTARNLFADGNYFRSLYASGAGSAINLTNLTNVVVSSSGYPLQIDAYAGGRIDLRQLRTTEGYIGVGATGEDSLIDLTSLSGLWSSGPSGYKNSVSASDGGTVAIQNVTALALVDLNVSGSGNVPTAQLRSYAGGSISFTSRTNGLEGLTNFSGSISAYDTRLDLTNFTALHATNGDVRLSASQGSLIDLSWVTNLVTTSFYALYATARGGSRIVLRSLPAPKGLFYVDAQGAGSVVDLSGFSGPWHGTGNVKAWDGASVLIPNVTTMSNIYLDLRADAVVPTAQLRSFTGGTITLTRRTNGFAGLTNFSGSFSVSDTRLDLTNFTVLYATNSQVSFQAGQGSFIDLSSVTNLVTSSLGYGLYASASGGSRIDLRRLRAPEGLVNVTASETGSVVDLSGFSGVWRGGGVTAGSGGSVLMPDVTSLDGVSLNVSGSANVNLAQLNSITAGMVTLNSRTNDFPGVTNFTPWLTANNSKIYLTNVTVLYVTNNHQQLQANQGSLIDLSRVTNVVKGGWTLTIGAASGGRIDLSRLPVLEQGPVTINAQGTGSLVDLTGLNGLWQVDGGVSVNASSGATVAISNVTAIRRISFDLSGDANVPMAQFHSFTEGSIRLANRTNVFAQLTNFTGNLLCFTLARAEFPRLTQLVATNARIDFTSGNDSVIDLSQVTNAVIDFGKTLSLYAYNRSRIEVPLLETIVAGNMTVQADGAGSVVDLSSLTGFFSDNNGGRLSSSSGGTILLNNDAMLLAGVAINLQSNPGGPVPPFLAPSQSLVLYGQPWRSYRIESRNPAVADSPWSLYRRVPLTGPLQMVSSRPPKDLVLRVYAFIADPPEVDLRSPAPGVIENILFGVPERSYRLESTVAPGGSINWENGPATTLTNSFFIFPSAGATNDARFFRAREL